MDETNEINDTGVCGADAQGDDFLDGWDDLPADAAPEGEMADEAGAEAPEQVEEAEAPVSPVETDRPIPQGELQMRADILEFARSFPEAAANPAAIPPQIWAEVGQGSSLTAAYARWAVGQERARTAAAQQRTETLERSRRNAARSTGSMQTAGDSARRRDPFLEGWDE